MTNSVKVIVATHKKYEMPKDEMYLPLHVGAAGKFDDNGNPLDFGYIKDNTGNNISEKNFCFGSQTGLYWAWKNLKADYLGLVHYRRYFVGRKINKKNPINSILTEKQLNPMLENYKIFVPQKRKYYIETIYSHYKHTLDAKQLDITEEIIANKCPEYLKSFRSVMNESSAYIFNMLIMKYDLFNEYCSWLFPILFELENKIDTTNMSSFEKRFCGRISEILFNVWLKHKILTGEVQKDEIKELPYYENVNWPRKIKSFLMAKFFNKKYEASF